MEFTHSVADALPGLGAMCSGRDSQNHVLVALSEQLLLARDVFVWSSDSSSTLHHGSRQEGQA